MSKRSWCAGIQKAEIVVLVARGLPASAALTIEDGEVHESLRGMDARIEALELLPHTLSAEYLSFEASPTGAGIGTTREHSLGRVPRGALLIGIGIAGLGNSQASDIVMTTNISQSTDKTVVLTLRRMITAGAFSGTFHILLF